MTYAVFAPASPAPPPPPFDPEAWPGISQTWTSQDGAVWALTGNNTGVRLRPGVRGYTMPILEDFTDEAAGVDGQFYTGYRVAAREVFWPILLVQGGSSQAWLDYDRAFWRTMQPGRYGTWTVRQPDGSARHLRMRCISDSQPSWENLPARLDWQPYGLTFVADDPYWYGSTITVTGEQTGTADFIDPDGSPPFHIAGGSGLDGLTIPNPGDVDAWPRWTAVGPHTGLTVGVGGRLITGPDLAPGQRLVIDTSPWVQAATLDGVDVTAELGNVDFAPVPPGATVPLFASSSGAGTVQVALSPRYFRAW